jgi:AraC-like DNA-binding protein
MSQYFPLIQDATSLTLDIENDWASLNYKILDPDIWPRHQDAMYSLGIYAKLIKSAMPEEWDHVELSVEIEAGDVKADLSSILGTNVLFGRPANSLRFPVSWLDKELSLAKPATATLLQNLSRQLVRKRRATPITLRTREMIFSGLGSGRVGQEYVAPQPSMTSRNLRRKLFAEGQSYQVLLDDCRMHSAAHELKSNRKLSLSELALKLGYSEHSTFSRAFVRWAGTAPQNYRREVL